VAFQPQEFDGGPHRARGWKIGADTHTTNPAYSVREGDRVMVRLWAAWHAHGLLPEAGGLLDQAHLNMEAIRFLDQVYADELKPLLRGDS
jgi:hypothetical protein